MMNNFKYITEEHTEHSQMCGCIIRHSQYQCLWWIHVVSLWTLCCCYTETLAPIAQPSPSLRINSISINTILSKSLANTYFHYIYNYLIEITR